MATDFIYLASQSPRRSELLQQIGVPYRVLPADIAETRRPGEAPEHYVGRLAGAKAEEVWTRVAAEMPRGVLAADTVVTADSDLFGKPDDEAEALAMLERLSDRTHTVLTGVALRTATGLETRVAASKVRFRATTAAERLAYCRTGEPYDKAGAYAIQGLGAVFVAHIEGSYSSVMGLPLAETAAMLAPVGLPPWLTRAGHS